MSSVKQVIKQYKPYRLYLHAQKIYLSVHSISLWELGSRWCVKNNCSWISYTTSARKQQKGFSLLTRKMVLGSTFPRQHFGQKTGQSVSSWRARFVTFLNLRGLRHRPLQTRTLAVKLGRSPRDLHFSFLCFKVSHPRKTHYNITMMPSP